MAPCRKLGLGAVAHVPSRALLRLGKFLSMAEEEGFDRQKRTMQFSNEAIRLLLAKKGLRIEKLREMAVPHSLWHIFVSIPHYLGFAPFHEEWRVMGMSVYGTPRYVKGLEELALALKHSHEYRGWTRDRTVQRGS